MWHGPKMPNQNLLERFIFNRERETMLMTCKIRRLYWSASSRSISENVHHQLSGTRGLELTDAEHTTQECKSIASVMQFCHSTTTISEKQQQTIKCNSPRHWPRRSPIRATTQSQQIAYACVCAADREASSYTLRFRSGTASK